MASAWNQVIGVEAANRALRLAQLAKRVAAALHRRHLDRLTESAVVSATERVHGKLLDAPATTVWSTLAASTLPPAVTTGAFRRLLRSRGPVVKAAGVGAAAGDPDRRRRGADGRAGRPADHGLGPALHPARRRRPPQRRRSDPDQRGRRRAGGARRRPRHPDRSNGRRPLPRPRPGNGAGTRRGRPASASAPSTSPGGCCRRRSPGCSPPCHASSRWPRIPSRRRRVPTLAAQIAELARLAMRAQHPDRHGRRPRRPPARPARRWPGRHGARRGADGAAVRLGRATCSGRLVASSRTNRCPTSRQRPPASPSWWG